MPGTLLIQSAPVEAVAVREGVEVFGGRDALSPARVEVRVSVCLSFSELVGLLTFAGSLTYEEIADDDHAVRESLQYAVIDTDLDTMERYAQRAWAAYRGVPDLQDVDAVAFVRCVALAVTRVFGVSA